MRQLRHLTQPTSDSCVATCAAMVVGDKVVDVEFHKQHYLAREQTLISYLTSRGLQAWRPTYTEGVMPHVMMKGYIYLVQTVSLNFENAFHMVVVDHRTEHPRILDPNVGREGLLTYVKFGSGVYDLRNWTVEAIVDPTHIV